MKSILIRIKRKISKLLGREVVDPLRYDTRAYAQQGEDMVMNCLLQWDHGGFYVDVGAHHPLRYSNTQLFYEKGWRGINIDPNPGIMREFARYRPDDINVEIGVAAMAGNINYFVFSDPAVNTFDEVVARECDSKGDFKLLRTVEIEVKPLKEILAKYLPPDQTIDFLSIDVEGFDLDVLSSNDWEKFRPRILIVEDLDVFTFDEVMKSKITSYLDLQGYVPISKMTHSIFYAEKSRISAKHGKLIY